MPVIFDRPSVNIIIDEDCKMFNVNIISEHEYDEKGFEEFLLYFKNTWSFLSKNNEIYFMIIDISTSGNFDFPITATLKLIHMIYELHNIFVKHLHSCCIVSSGAEKWQNIYDIVSKLYSADNRRPIKFTENKEECKLFLLSNKILH